MQMQMQRQMQRQSKSKRQEGRQMGGGGWRARHYSARLDSTTALQATNESYSLRRGLGWPKCNTFSRVRSVREPIQQNATQHKTRDNEGQSTFKFFFFLFLASAFSFLNYFFLTRQTMMMQRNRTRNDEWSHLRSQIGFCAIYSGCWRTIGKTFFCTTFSKNI